MAEEGSLCMCVITAALSHSVTFQYCISPGTHYRQGQQKKTPDKGPISPSRSASLGNDPVGTNPPFPNGQSRSRRVNGPSCVCTRPPPLLNTIDPDGSEVYKDVSDARVVKQMKEGREDTIWQYGAAVAHGDRYNDYKDLFPFTFRVNRVEPKLWDNATLRTIPMTSTAVRFCRTRPQTGDVNEAAAWAARSQSPPPLVAVLSLSLDVKRLRQGRFLSISKAQGDRREGLQQTSASLLRTGVVWKKWAFSSVVCCQQSCAECGVVRKTKQDEWEENETSHTKRRTNDLPIRHSKHNRPPSLVTRNPANRTPAQKKNIPSSPQVSQIAQTDSAEKESQNRRPKTPLRANTISAAEAQGTRENLPSEGRGKHGDGRTIYLAGEEKQTAEWDNQAGGSDVTKQRLQTLRLLEEL
ncbi:hypothetical protein BaRGS_00018812 [Batillaria attramentaria]|uniref:Uncharacterized protein n=1 Tax=Batillaria attramentaria TaxID=370345 RepID=A0ABD0KRQ0_9CAEN